MDVKKVSRGLSKDDLLNVRVFKDGNKWCALHGEDLQEGTAGFGCTPQDALRHLADNLELDLSKS